MRKLSLLALVALIGGCATPQQQKQINAAITISQAVANSGLLNTQATTAVNTVVESDRVVNDVQNVIANDNIVIVKPGDTLWGLAKTAYNGTLRAPGGRGGFLWPIICTENNLANCSLITPLELIRVPKPEIVGTMPASQVAAALNQAYGAKP